LVTAGQLAANEDRRPPAWIDPPARDREANPSFGYVVSFIRFHERGFATPTSRFLRRLCFHYGVELHNFASNTISQAATFVGVCEGFLGIPVNWDLWVHLFRAKLHTVTTPEPKTRRAVRASGVTIALRETRRELYIPYTMTSNNAEWERGWFYLRNDKPGLPPWTGKVVREKADSWWHGVSPSSRQDQVDSALKVLKALADAGLTAASVLANLHHRRIIPLMERRLCIFEMEETADPVVLAQSRLLPDLLPQEYAAMRARHTVNLKVIRNDDDVLWSFAMLPEGPLVSRIPALLRSIVSWSIVVIGSFTRPLQVMAVNAARSEPPTPRARARAQRSGGSKSGRRARRRRGSGDGSAGNREVRSSGCASSWDSPPRRLRSTRRRTKRRRRATGDGLPPRGGSLRPPRLEPRRQKRRQRLGGRGSARRQAAYKRGDARHGGASARRGVDWGQGGCHIGGGHNVRRAPEEEEAGILHPEVGDRCPTRRVFEMSEGSTLLFSRSQGSTHRAPLAPAKVLRSDAAVPTRWHSSRVSWAAGSTATAASEGSRGTAAALEPQPAVAAMELLQAATAAETRQAATAAEPRQAATVTTATTATVVAVPSTPPAPAAAGNPRAVVVEVPDDDVPPPGWDQWASLPASAPEASTGALVVMDDGGVAASSSHDALPSSGSPTVRPEQERERAGAPPDHFVEAQAEQGLWWELRDHGASLNRALNEAVRIHSGPVWRIFQVSWISLSLAVPPPALFRVRAFPDSFSSRLDCWRQDLERQARERYDALDRLDADLH
jgi:hypothetical protein